MRRLARCSDCGRVFDASALEVGAYFHCRCGAAVEVPQGKGKEAAVLRCSGCGGSRSADAVTCAHCGSRFTVAEQDLGTVCPGCFARVSDRAAFCHHCGNRLGAEAIAGEALEVRCPACANGAVLHSRQFEPAAIGFDECYGCGGLWLSQRAFELLRKNAQESGDWLEAAGLGRAPVEATPAEKPVYRSCPGCSKLMHRRNYGRRSGVIVDVCQAHGIWFDRDELPRLLGWIRGGGLQELRRLEAEEQRQAELRARGRRLPTTTTASLGGPGGSLVGRLLREIFRFAE